jgi:site-specific recombinase XerD
VYRLSLRRLVAGLGPDLSLAELDTPLGVRRVTGWFSERYGGGAPATWNRELATIRSVFGRWRTDGLMHCDPTEALHTGTVRPDRTRALTRTQVEALWERDVDLRERTLWRLPLRDVRCSPGPATPSARSLERYARPSADAVARHVAANDPARRRAR